MGQKSVPQGLTMTSGGTQSMYYTTNQARDWLTMFANANKYVATTQNSAGYAFGTGDTPPTLIDYWLSGELIPTISIVAATITTDIADGVYMFKNAITVSNSGANSIVINEMAIIANLYYSSTSGTTGMLDRTVLDTPLTLAPGEQGVITYTFNLPIVQ